jgi:alkyldihydroxyacetonephosphate synthase
MTDSAFPMPDDPASRWAAPADPPLLGRDLRELLVGLFGGAASPDIPAGSPPLPEPLLADTRLDPLRAIVGAAHVDRSDAVRRAHANGMSYLDLVTRDREIPAAPDAVVAPGTEAEVAALLTACAEAGIAVVPFGGGTSVVGGLAPERGGHAGVIALDLTRLDALVELDEVSRTATLQAGMTGPRADELLAPHGLTIGHVPQSFERATIGGYAVTRSAGQLSAGWGRFDDLVERVRMVTPAGLLDVGRAPGTAAGPDLRELVLGSEGTFGVVTEVTVRVRPVPQERRHEGWTVGSFAEGLSVLRRLAQDGPCPDLLRLSDETETAMGVATAGAGQEGGGCTLLIGWEGAADDVARRAGPAIALLQEAGARPRGEEAAEAWRHGRFRGPRLRDELLPLGVLTETLETAIRWRDVGALHAAVGDALRSSLGEDAAPLVACHVSHVYPAGASLYFTVLARRDDADPMEQWRAAKRAAGDAMAARGATITHHHAVGRDHAPWMPQEVGDLGVEALRAVKDRLDPAGIMNPGKLLPD